MNFSTESLILKFLNLNNSKLNQDQKFNMSEKICCFQSGLIDKVRSSKNTEKCVENSLLYFLMKYIPKGKCAVAGNTVYMDRLFLQKYMPVVNDYCHYRVIDVSTIKELVK